MLTLIYQLVSASLTDAKFNLTVGSLANVSFNLTVCPAKLDRHLILFDSWFMTHK